MVSRFAMNLPDFTQPQPWSEPSCDWEILEEVSPLFSEERRLLHAGRALCCPGRTPRRFRRRALDARLRQPLVHLRAESVRRARAIAVATATAAAHGRRVLRLRVEPSRALQLRRGRAAAGGRGVPSRLRIAHAVLDDDQPRIEFARCVRPERSRRDLRADDGAAECLRPSGRRGRAPGVRIPRLRRRGRRQHALQPAGRPRAGIRPRPVRGSAGQLLSQVVPRLRRRRDRARCSRSRWCRATTWRT